MGSASIESMAKAMGVTHADVLSLVNMVSTSLTKDGMKDIFISMNEVERVNTVEAYIAAEVKKFSNFCLSLLTNTEKKSAFDQYLFYKLKEA
tara:strand:- start:587 stop:862 length:276 start_codon:yes stop_codon:yes gene_type:complete